MVVVIDEYGNTPPRTMEDLLEVIIGEIRDEHEPIADVAKTATVLHRSGSFDLDRVGDLIQGFHKEEEVESTTIGGLAGEWLGPRSQTRRVRRPRGLRIEVLAADELRVNRFASPSHNGIAE